MTDQKHGCVPTYTLTQGLTFLPESFTMPPVVTEVPPAKACVPRLDPDLNSTVSAGPGTHEEAQTGTIPSKERRLR